MKIYIININDAEDNDHNEPFTNKNKALKFFNDADEDSIPVWSEVDIPISKEGILDAIRYY